MGFYASARAHAKSPRYVIYPVTTVAMPVPNGESAFLLSGTTVSIPSLDSAIRPGRVIWFIGAAGSSGMIPTDTAIASTAYGKISLNGTITLAPGASLCLKCLDAGGWQELFRANVG